jgi:hypothetical protein
MVCLARQKKQNQPWLRGMKAFNMDVTEKHTVHPQATDGNNTEFAITAGS